MKLDILVQIEDFAQARITRPGMYRAPAEPIAPCAVSGEMRT